MRVLRVYHAGRDPGHRRREQALVRAGVDLTLVVPSQWHDQGSQQRVSAESYPITELEITRSGDVNRHEYVDLPALSAVLNNVRPDILDVHEEPVSVAARQWLTAQRRTAPSTPVVMYTAQNLDKRFPPPFSRYERRAYDRVSGFYPCSRQAASVIRGKGFGGLVSVLPLGVDLETMVPGAQSVTDEVVTLGFVGRLTPEKGLDDAVHVLAALQARRPARLIVVGEGPALRPALALADRLAVRHLVEVAPWASAQALASRYRSMHVVLVPSRGTATWVEQFGRVIVEAQACGAVVVGYRSGTVAEVGGPASVCVPEGDHRALTVAVLDLVANPAHYATLRRLGVGQAATCTWDAVAAGQCELYEAVLTRPRPLPEPGTRTAARARAHAEFGPPAQALGQDRPFALPVLRNPTRLSRTLAGIADMMPP